MTSDPSGDFASSPLPASTELTADLSRVAARLSSSLERDRLVQVTLDGLRMALEVDRTALYYFYRRWKGQVTAESIVDPSLSILGSTGADRCFNDEYAEMYLKGRIRAIPDILHSGIHPCHLDFLRSLQVRANLVAPILTEKGLWGLVVAHHCEDVRQWSAQDVQLIRNMADQLAQARVIRQS